MFHRYFHVTEGLIPDVMHDLLEGALPFQTKELLLHLINTNEITLNELNSNMTSFPFTGADSANKPKTISHKTMKSKDHLLKQTGMCVLIVIIIIIIIV